ncbi:Protein fluG [Cladobotryum mycophilum]|uniref:Glutamine synthetase n=1 Tax=Cladobotryum mycophilum TaxID=491253 RepID=A0ABR0SUU2_9HYPO
MTTGKGDVSESLLKDFLNTHHHVQFIRLQWVDYSGVLRARIVTKSIALKLASGSDEYSVPQSCLITPLSGPSEEFFEAIEDWKLIPDWSSLAVCGFRPSHAAVMCFTAQAGLEDPLARCPRKLLSTLVQEVEEKCGSKILMGFEMEFSFHDEAGNIVRTIDRSIDNCMMAGLRTTNLTILEDVVLALQTSGVESYHIHVERGDQFEIALAPMPPMQAIDAVVMAQETLRTISLQHGLRASLAPKPVYHGPLHGLHFHFSLNPTPANAPAFLAGVLSKLRTLCVFGLPSFDSYSRVVEECVGEWVGYGTGNRDMPIRRVNDGRWEFRLLDATANAYLFTAAMLASGLEGVKEKRELTMKDCQIVTYAFEPEEAEEMLRKHGITERLPATLAESIEVARKDEGMKALVGEMLLKKYLQVKSKDNRCFGLMTEEERRLRILDFF